MGEETGVPRGNLQWTRRSGWRQKSNPHPSQNLYFRFFDLFPHPPTSSHTTAIYTHELTDLFPTKCQCDWQGSENAIPPNLTSFALKCVLLLESRNLRLSHTCQLDIHYANTLYSNNILFIAHSVHSTCLLESFAFLRFFRLLFYVVESRY